MIRAFLFDSDGVLVDSEALFFQATQRAFAAERRPLSRAQWAKWYLGEGKGSRDIALLCGIPPSFVERTIERRDRFFWDRVQEGVPVLPGVREILGQLSLGFRLAVVTGASREHFHRVHAATRLPGFFEAVIATNDYAQPKPSPEAYLTALRVLGLKPEECMAVEDSPRGARAALGAGIRCVVVPTELTDRQICPSQCEILEDITGLRQFVSPGNETPQRNVKEQR